MEKLTEIELNVEDLSKLFRDIHNGDRHAIYCISIELQCSSPDFYKTVFFYKGDLYEKGVTREDCFGFVSSTLLNLRKK